MNRKTWLLKHQDLHFYISNMNDVLCDWTKKRIDGTKAIQRLEDYLDTGLKVFERRENIDADKKALEECFDSLVSHIKNNISYENDIFMKLLKKEAKKTYEAMKKALDINLVVYKDGLFNFKCTKGSVGRFFFETGFTDYKRIIQHILINGNTPSYITLLNGGKNTPPKEWANLEKELSLKPIKNKPKITTI